MAIALPERTASAVGSLTPRQIVAELDKYVVGQAKAKRAVAIALRNRFRRQRLPAEMAEEVTPKNILMIGPTGVGKTEIARRLARLAQSPFIKVEASKFTEVGYVGRDVESMVRDLVELAVEMVRARAAPRRWRTRRGRPPRSGCSICCCRRRAASRRPTTRRTRSAIAHARAHARAAARRPPGRPRSSSSTRARPRCRRSRSSPGRRSRRSASNLKDMMGQFFQRAPEDAPAAACPRRSTHLAAEEQAKLVDMESVSRTAVQRVEQSGIIFIDEIDKIASRDGGHGGHGPDVSREGVQRDILPIVEGTTVNTKHGMVKTDHILFIAAGAFHVSKPSDLIPELQGRFPIRVELDALTRDDFVRILTEPRGSLVKQYTALLGAEDVTLTFTPDAVERIADFAARVNDHDREHRRPPAAHRDGAAARRVSFEAPELARQDRRSSTRPTSSGCWPDIVKNEDLSRYIL